MWMCGHLLGNKFQMRHLFPIFIFIFLPPFIGSLFVFLSHHGIKLPEVLVYPLGTDSLFYAQGTTIFHAVIISLLYLLIGTLMYLGYKCILEIIHRMKYKK